MPKKHARASVTGLGAISAFGEGVARFWDGLVQGKRAMSRSERFASAGLDIGPLALVSSLLEDVDDRAGKLALFAAREALADAADLGTAARIGLTLGTTLGGIEAWLPVVRGEKKTADRFGYAGTAHLVAGTLGVNAQVQVLSLACASGNAAIGAGLEMIREGRADVVLAGGADALHEFVVSGFASLKATDAEPCRPFDRARRGLNLGEGAAFLVLESEAHARARGAKIRAFLEGYGAAADAVHMTGPDREGRGAARAMIAALTDAGRTPNEIDFVSAHGTATPFNDLMEGKAIALALGAQAKGTPVNSIKGSIGHTLGASGAFEAVMCVRSLESGLVIPTTGLAEIDPEIALDLVYGRPREADCDVALSTSSGFGGSNASLIFSRSEGAPRSGRIE